MPLLPPAVAVSKFAERLHGNDGTPPFLALESSGVILNEKITGAEHATLIGLAQVTLRTEEFARLRYLKRAEAMDVLNKGAYSYKKGVVLEQQPNAHAKVDNRNACVS